MLKRADSTQSGLRNSICAKLTDARERTLLLVACLTDEDLRVQHDPLMSPILWDLGHIAHFEELWLTRNLSGKIEFSEMPGMYNPFEHPRATRAALPLPSLQALMHTAAEIRADTLAALESADLHSDHPLLAGGFVYNMVLQHEYQHNETILQTLQLKTGEPYRASADLHSDHPLLAGGFVYNMVLQHEYQHNETILQTLQLKTGEPYRAPRAIAAPPAGSDAFDRMVRVDAGT